MIHARLYGTSVMNPNRISGRERSSEHARPTVRTSADASTEYGVHTCEHGLGEIEDRKMMKLRIRSEYMNRKIATTLAMSSRGCN